MILRNANLATISIDPSFGLIEDGALVVEQGDIKWVGKRTEIPAKWQSTSETVDCGGRLITPGLIDCHTHVVYAGNRAREFEQRLEGASYQEIAQAGRWHRLYRDRHPLSF